MYKHEHYTAEHVAEYTALAKKKQDTEAINKTNGVLLDGLAIVL